MEDNLGCDVGHSRIATGEEVKEGDVGFANHMLDNICAYMYTL